MDIEQSKKQLQELISRLEAARNGMTAGSKAASELESSVSRLGVILQKIENGELKRFTASLDAFVKKLEATGKATFQGARFNLRGAQFNPNAEQVAARAARYAQAPDDFRGAQGGMAAAADAEYKGYTRIQQLMLQDIKKIDDQKIAQAQAANRALIKEEEEALQKRAMLLKRDILNRSKAATEAASTAARQNLAPHLFGGQEAANRVQGLASKVDPNFTPQTIKSVITEATTGISRINYAYNTADGILKKMTVTVDRFGGVLADTQKRFRGFASNVARDIAEVAKWSIAVAVVYGPMQAFSQLLQTMIENETALADIAVSLGDAQRDVNEIFDAAATIAAETGEALNQVLEAYNTAYRATGSITDATERFTTANILLKDSIVLAKLSTLDEVQSIDILSAALKQSGMNLDQGTILLDKWVRTTKNANVDMTTLATGFAVVGDAAEAAGVGADKLNAVLAVIAETSNSTGKEVANTARAIIAGFQSDNARKELVKLGISLENTSGDARGFITVMQQLSDLRQTGALGDEAFSKLTLALGGGTRRQAAYSTFIENFGKVARIEAESAKASGDSADALAKKLDTVQTATSKLSNAFQELAQALGEDGGLLDIFKNLLLLGGGIVKVIADITSALGKAGPVLIATLGMVGYLSKQTDLKRGAISGGFGNIVGGIVSGLTYPFGRLKQVTTDVYNPATGLTLPGQMPANQMLGMQAGTWATRNAKFFGGAAIGAVSSIGNFAQGNATAGIANITGAIIGALVTGGSPIGAAIGSAGAEALIKGIQNMKPELQEAFKDIYAPPAPADEMTPAKLAEEQAFDDLYKLLGHGNEGLGRFLALFNTGILQATGWIQGIASGQEFQGLNSTQAALITLGQLQSRVSGNPLYANTQKQIEDILKGLQAGVQPIQEARAQQNAFQAQYGDQLEAAIVRAQQKLRTQYVNREISGAAYRQGLSGLEALPTAAYQYKDLISGDPTKFFDALALVTSRGNVDDLEEMAQLLSEMTDAQYDAAADGVAGYSSALGDMGAKADAAKNFLSQLNTELLAQAKLLDEINFSDYGKGQVDLILNLARKKQEEFYQRQVATPGGMSQAEADAQMKAFEDIIISYLGGFTHTGGGLQQRFITEAENEAKAKGLLPDKQTNVGFQQFDMSMAKFEAILAKGYQPLLNQLIAAGYTSEATKEVALFDDGQVKPYTKDWKIVQYLLQQILDVEQKQLDGMFNLPEGASFYVPYNASKYGLGAGTGNPLLDQTSNTLPGGGSGSATRTKPVTETPTYTGGMPKELWDQYMNRPFYTTSLTSDKSLGSGDVNEILGGADNVLTTTLNLTINTTTTLTVDGRVLATVIKPYLTQDLVRYAGGGVGSKVLTMR